MRIYLKFWAILCEVSFDVTVNELISVRELSLEDDSDVVQIMDVSSTMHFVSLRRKFLRKNSDLAFTNRVADPLAGLHAYNIVDIHHI